MLALIALTSSIALEDWQIKESAHRKLMFLKGLKRLSVKFLV